MFENYGGDSETNSGEKIGAVMEDEIEPEVVWEQRVKDVEAERERRVVTSPGFSFSAAGLLFPYHLGVARFLIENGYIKVRSLYRNLLHESLICYQNQFCFLFVSIIWVNEVLSLTLLNIWYKPFFCSIYSYEIPTLLSSAFDL